MITTKRVSQWDWVDSWKGQLVSVKGWNTSQAQNAAFVEYAKFLTTGTATTSVLLFTFIFSNTVLLLIIDIWIDIALAILSFTPIVVFYDVVYHITGPHLWNGGFYFIYFYFLCVYKKDEQFFLVKCSTTKK